jgi:hypothetical protein
MTGGPEIFLISSGNPEQMFRKGKEMQKAVVVAPARL